MIVMNDISSSHNRKLSVYDIEFTKRIEEILKKIKRLETSDKGLKRRKITKVFPQKNLENSGFPLLTFTKIPYRPERGFSNRLPKPSPVHPRNSSLCRTICYTETSEIPESLNGSKLAMHERILSPNKEKYQKIMKMTEKMIFKDELRGWSRH
jgi:hypothetical protein